MRRRRRRPGSYRSPRSWRASRLSGTARLRWTALGLRTAVSAGTTRSQRRAKPDESVSRLVGNLHVGSCRPALRWSEGHAAGGEQASPARIISDMDIRRQRRMTVALTRAAELMMRAAAIVEKLGGRPRTFRRKRDGAADEAGQSSRQAAASSGSCR